MEMLTGLIAGFYAIPIVDNLIQSNTLLRLAVMQFGALLFVLGVVFIVLVMALVLSRLKAGKSPPKKQGRRKKKQPLKTLSKDDHQRAIQRLNQQLAGGKAPLRILKRLAQIPPEPLPLYPVADKRKPLTAERDEPSVLDDKLIANLPDASILDASVPDANLNDISEDDLAQDLMADDLADDLKQDTQEIESPEDSDAPDESPPPANSSSSEAFDPVPNLSFDPVVPPEPESAPESESESDDEPLDIAVASFGHSNEDDDELSSSAQEKLAELNDKGVT